MSTCRPNFSLIPGSYFPDSAFLAILESGEVAVYSSNRERGTPKNVFEGRVIEFEIDHRLTEDEISHLLKDVKGFVHDILIDSRIDVDRRGNLTRLLGDKAKCAIESIVSICFSYVTQDFDKCGDEYCRYCADSDD